MNLLSNIPIFSILHLLVTQLVLFYDSYATKITKFRWLNKSWYKHVTNMFVLSSKAAFFFSDYYLITHTNYPGNIPTFNPIFTRNVSLKSELQTCGMRRVALRRTSWILGTDGDVIHRRRLQAFQYTTAFSGSHVRVDSIGLLLVLDEIIVSTFDRRPDYQQHVCRPVCQCESWSTRHCKRYLCQEIYQLHISKLMTSVFVIKLIELSHFTNLNRVLRMVKTQLCVGNKMVCNRSLLFDWEHWPPMEAMPCIHIHTYREKM